MTRNLVYLDHAATSPLLPEVLDAMLPWLGVPANPSSVHAAGRKASAALEDAREAVAALLGRPAQGIVFVSGATEGNHTAIGGLCALGAQRFAAAPIEHPSVLGALSRATGGWQELPVGPDGVVSLDGLTDAALDALVLQAVNHELGTIQPLSRAAAIAEQRGWWLHVDATQGAGRLDLPEGIDTVVLSSHKLGGPVGIGALSLGERLVGERFPALLTGGSQERQRRAGTVNVAGAVGFARACLAASRDRQERAQRHQALARSLREGLAQLGARIIVSDPASTLPSITTFSIPSVRGDLIVQALDLRGVAVSSGAACASGSTGPSPVLAAIAFPEPAGGVRVSFGPNTARADIDALLAALADALPAIRLAAEWEP